MENDDNILKDCLGSSVNVGVWLVMTFAADRSGHGREFHERLLPCKWSRLPESSQPPKPGPLHFDRGVSYTRISISQDT